MYDEYRRRENLHRSHDRSGRETGRENQKRGGFSLTLFQIIVTVLVIAAAVILRQVGGGFYKTVQKSVTQAFSEGVTQAQISQVIAAVKSSLPDAKDLLSSSSAAGASSKASGSSQKSSSSSSSSSSSASSGRSSSASNSVSAGSSASAASAAVSKTGAAINLPAAAAGGSDLAAATASSGMLVAPKTASLGPFLLSVKPVWPVQGDITSGFGYRINPITKAVSFHTGIDIASPEGTPIGAALPGTVTDVGTNAAYGNYVLLSHGGGVETFYGHCKTVAVKKGDIVRQGQTIAAVGTTGMSTGFHVHFEIRIEGIRVNPTWVLTTRM